MTIACERFMKIQPNYFPVIQLTNEVAHRQGVMNDESGDDDSDELISG